MNYRVMSTVAGGSLVSSICYLTNRFHLSKILPDINMLVRKKLIINNIPRYDRPLSWHRSDHSTPKHGIVFFFFF